MNTNRAASIRARLLNLAKERGEDFSLTLNRYAVERYLYRLTNRLLTLTGAALRFVRS